MLKLVKKLGSFVGGRITLRQHLVEVVENGHQFCMEVAEVAHAVAVLAITEKGTVLLVQNFRYPVGEEILEIPAGKMEGENDDPMKRCAAELEEEAGYVADDWAAYGEIMTSPGITNERIRLYRAMGLKFVGRKLEATEAGMKVVEVTVDEIKHKLANHLIKDAKTRMVLTEYLLHLSDGNLWNR